MTNERTGSVPLVEEQLHLGKRHVTTGKVRVRSVVDAVEEVAHATLETQRVEVTRVPVGKEITAIPAVRTEGDVVIVPIVEEIVVLEKRLVLKEELRIHRYNTEENVEVPVTLRKQRAVVERETLENQADKEITE